MKNLNLRKKEKNSKGITLLALIVTIIVLLILAGVTVATLTGDNGILTKVGEAKQKSNKAEVYEELQLAVLNSSIKRNGKIDTTDLKSELERLGFTVIEKRDGSNGLIGYEVSKRGFTFEINLSTGEIIDKETEIANGGSNPVNSTFTITPTITNGTYSGATSISNGKTVTITITPNNAYDLPSDVTVTGATKSYNSETGVLTLSNATEDVSITGVCGLHLETFKTCGFEFVFAPGMTWGDFIELQGSKNDWKVIDDSGIMWYNWILDGPREDEEIVANRTYEGYLFCCFDAGSKILMSDGSEKNIEEIVSGDEVLSYNESTHVFVPETVGKLIVNNFSSDLVYVHLSDGRTLGMTAYHPLLTTEGWKSLQPEIAKKQLGITEDVGLMEIGDNLIEYGSIGKIVDIEYRNKKEGYKTYTLSMDGDIHNFIVNNVVAHNAAEKCYWEEGEMPNASVYQRDCVTGHWPKQ